MRCSISALPVSGKGAGAQALRFHVTFRRTLYLDRVYTQTNRPIPGLPGAVLFQKIMCGCVKWAVRKNHDASTAFNKPSVSVPFALRTRIAHTSPAAGGRAQRLPSKGGGGVQRFASGGGQGGAHLAEHTLRSTPRRSTHPGSGPAGTPSVNEVRYVMRLD